MGVVLDHILPFFDLEARVYASKINTAAVATTFPANTAGAELVGDWSMRFHAEFYGAALAASLQEPDGNWMSA
jgi:hypothetical protein